MYKFMNNPYLRGPFFEADKGGGAGSAGGSDTGDNEADQSDTSDEEGEGAQEEEKKFTQKDVDEAVKRQLEKEKRKWRRESKKGNEDSKDNEPEDSDAEERVRKAEEKAENYELKWACMEHDVKKDCVDDVLALAKVYASKNEVDIEDAIDKVVEKYPHFKMDTDSQDENSQSKRGWGQRQGRAPKAQKSLDDTIREQIFGK